MPTTLEVFLFDRSPSDAKLTLETLRDTGIRHRLETALQKMRYIGNTQELPKR